MNFSIGETVGDYRILEELGRGGMGQVFRVEHTITKRLEAMKVLQGGRPEAPEQAARFLHEIQIQASLDHPNIAAVHTAFWAGEDLVLIMELIDGLSLRGLVEAGRPPLATAVDYASQALSALSYAHGHGVIHRDVSPANMMVTAAGILKLTDFGLARRPADARLSRSGAPVGSPYYMSPEQVRGHAADARSDVYSLGAVLYELTTGRRPFDGESAFSIMADHVQTPPVPPIKVEPALPLALDRAILRSLEKDPAERFPSAEQFRDALLAVRSVRTMPHPRRPAKILRSWVMWASVSLVVVVGMTLSGLFRSHPPFGSNESASAAASRHDIQPPPTRGDDTEPLRQRDQPTKQVARSRAKPAPNPMKRVLGRLWPFARHKKSPSGDTTSSGPSPMR